MAQTSLARGLVARTAVPAVSMRSSSLCMQASRLRVLVPVADDSEEIETACITDTLVRAGAEVVVASVMPELQVRMSRGLKVVADCLVVVRGAGCTLCCFLIRVQETGRLASAVTRVKQTRESKCTISVFLLTTSNSLSSILP